MSQSSVARAGRVAWTVVTIFIVECLVFGLSGLPAFLFWTWALSWATPPLPLVRPLILAISLVPAYLVFATDADHSVGRLDDASSDGGRRLMARGG